MKYISKVQLPDGSTFYVKDIEAREQLDILLTDEFIFNCGGAPTECDEEFDVIISCGGAPVCN